MSKNDIRNEVVKVHAALESASSQLAQQPTNGIFFINDHIYKSAPVVAQKAQSVLEEEHSCKLSKEQAQEATAAINSLKTSGAAFCINMHQQLDQAMLACNMLPTATVCKSPAFAAAEDYMIKLPQLLSLSRLNLTRKST